MLPNQPVIILVEPQLAENVGMTARAMMNCGLYHLRLVNPREDHLSPKAVAASSGADKILRNAEIYASVEAAVADLQQIYAATARRRDMIKPVETADFAAAQITEAQQASIKCGILFGPERTGLHNDDVCLADAIIEIPLNPEHCSLNLSRRFCSSAMNGTSGKLILLRPAWLPTRPLLPTKKKFYNFLSTLKLN